MFTSEQGSTSPKSIFPKSFHVLDDAPVWMSMRERVVLYALIFGVRPEHCLEIGTFRGGSSLIISAALDDLGTGQLVCVDPAPQVTPEHWARIQHRATMIAGPSPGILKKAAEVSGGPFQFALVDGDHSRQGVIDDIDGILPLLSEDAHLLFHDAHYFEVDEAINDAIGRHGESLVDCGLVSTEQTPDPQSIDGRSVVWGGLRMLRYRRSVP